jgi:hypothetical protein
VLDKQTIELGAQKETCFACCLTRTEEAFSTVPREFDIKPQVSLVGKILLIHNSVLALVEKWATVYAFSTGSRMNRY